MDRLRLISAIADRAIRLGLNASRHKIDLVMDLDYADIDCPLDLEALMTADKGDFAHDVGGIIRHLDRETLKLTDCFCPRFAKACQEPTDADSREYAAQYAHAAGYPE